MVFICIRNHLSRANDATVSLHIVEDGRVITDEEGQELTERDAVRREAVETGASIARDAFTRGSASRVIVDVRKGDELSLKVSISLTIEG
jgi:hypothetical protein